MPPSDENREHICVRPASAPRRKRAVLRKSKSISLLIAVLFLALSIDFLAEAVRKNESVEDGAGLMTEAGRRVVADTHNRLLAGHDIDYRVVTARGLGISIRLRRRASRPWPEACAARPGAVCCW